MTRIRVENRMFKSKEEAAKFYNLKPSTVKWRLNNGWSIEETFELVDRNTNSYPFNGKNYKSINALYNDNEEYFKNELHIMNGNTLNNRINLGWSFEEAISIPKRAIRKIKKKKRMRPITLKGKKYRSIRSATKDKKVKYSTVIERLEKGYSLEKAFSKTKSKRYRPHIKITLEGVTYENLKKACIAYNVNYNKIRYRIKKKNWSIKKAFEIE